MTCRRLKFRALILEPLNDLDLSDELLNLGVSAYAYRIRRVTSTIHWTNQAAPQSQNAM
jgi:hypothetical protein